MESFTQQYAVSVLDYAVKPRKDIGRVAFFRLLMPVGFSSMVIRIAHEIKKLKLDLGGERVSVNAGNITCKVDKGENTMLVSVGMDELGALDLTPEEVATRAKYLCADGTPAQPSLEESIALLPEGTSVTVHRGGSSEPLSPESLEHLMEVAPPLEPEDITPPELPEGARAGLIELRVKQLMAGLTEGQDADDGSWEELSAKLSEQSLETLDGLHAQLEAGTLSAERVLTASDLSSAALSAAQVSEKRKAKKPSSAAAQISA